MHDLLVALAFIGLFIAPVLFTVEGGLYTQARMSGSSSADEKDEKRS
jgi:hypothetical protein